MGLRTSTITEQVAAHLLEEIRQGRWNTAIPGRVRLARELEVSSQTVQRAFKLLEEQGVLEAQGGGRRHKVVASSAVSEPRPIRVRILLYDDADRTSPEIVELFHLIEEEGFRCNYAPKTLQALTMDPAKVARMVNDSPADAWIVQGGSREVLQWFLEQSTPAFSLFGRFSGLPIAAVCPLKIPALKQAVRKLVDLGHVRIVMLAQEERRKPRPALMEQAFLDELETLGIKTSQYNLHDWGIGPQDFHRGIETLFRHTPPTALIVNESRLFVAARDHLSQRGIIAPRDVSLICDDPDQTFTWCDPPVSHISWDYRPVIRRALRWVRNIAKGNNDLRQTRFKTKFVEGGTIGPVARAR